METKRSMLRSIDEKIREIAINMEKFKMVDYAELLESPRRLLYFNFIGGLARGFGMAIGFTVLSAVVLYILQFFLRMNLPVIGKLIAEIIRFVEANRR